MLENPVGSHQPEVRLVSGQCCELTAARAGRGIVETMQHNGIATGTPVNQPAHGGRIAVESVATLQAGGNQQRYGNTAVAERGAEGGNIGQRAVAHPGDRNDQSSWHPLSLAKPGVRTVANTTTTGG